MRIFYRFLNCIVLLHILSIAEGQLKKICFYSLTNKEKGFIKIIPLSNGAYRIPITDSMPDGDYRFYEDTLLKTLFLKGKIKDKKKVGNWTYCYTNGNPSTVVPFVDGLINGKILRFTYTGDTCAIIPMSNNRLNGVSKIWYDTQSEMYALQGFKKRYIKAIQEYANDTLLSAKNYNYNGETMQAFLYSRDTVITTNYSRKGKIKKISYSIGKKVIKETVYENTSPDTRYELEIDFFKSKSATLLDSLPYFTNLEYLKLYFVESTKYQDSLMKVALESASKLVNLEELSITNYEDVPEIELTKVTQIKKLDIKCINKVSSSLSKLTKLEELILRGISEKSGETYYTIPIGIKYLTKLQYLWLIEMEFKNPESEIAKLITLPKLFSLRMPNCGLKKFPTCLGGFTKLVALDVAGTSSKVANTFNKLPDTVFTMKKLRYLMLPETFGSDWTSTTLPTYKKKLPKCVISIHFPCFPANTMITLVDGSQKAIQDLIEGDVLLCYDNMKSKVDTTTVIRTDNYHSEQKRMITILLDEESENLHMTSEHPVFVKGNQWTTAGNLTEGDVIFRRDEISGQIIERKIIQIKDAVFENLSLYNIGTDKNTYFANGIWVHNK